MPTVTTRLHPRAALTSGRFFDPPALFAAIHRSNCDRGCDLADASHACPVLAAVTQVLNNGPAQAALDDLRDDGATITCARRLEHLPERASENADDWPRSPTYVVGTLSRLAAGYGVAVDVPRDLAVEVFGDHSGTVVRVGNSAVALHRKELDELLTALHTARVLLLAAEVK